MDRRIDLRVNANISITLKRLDNSFLTFGSSQNITLDGMNLIIDKNITEIIADENIYCCFFLPKRENPFNLESKILEIKSINDSQFWVRLEFINLAKMEFYHLSNYISENFNEKSKQIIRRTTKRRQVLKNTETNTRDKEDRRLPIPTYRLLVDGKFIDTGKYDFYPYQHKMWTEPKQTMKILFRAKKGEWETGFEEYIFARYCVGTNELNKKAIESAYKASKKFKNFSLSARKKIFDDIYDLLKKHKKELIELMVVEGHPVQLAEWEYLGMESAYQRETISFFKNNLRQKIYQKNKENVYLDRRSDGVLVISPPKNAPITSIIGVLTLLVGNTIILKPPRKIPISTIYLWENVIFEALKKNGVPKGVINIVLGDSEIIMNEWLESPYINDILYFGESKRGLEIGEKAYLKGKKAILELSGNDMMFVWEDADIEQAVNSMLSCFFGSTQICMVPKKAIIHSEIYDKFRFKFLEKISNIIPRLPNDKKAILSPVLKIKEYYDFLNDALKKGAELLSGGYQINMNNEKDEKGMFIAPTVLEIDDIEKTIDMLCIQEENFFPLIPLVKVNGKNNKEIFEKMRLLSENNKYGLRNSIWVKDVKYIKKFAKEFSYSGLLRINSGHIDFSLGLSTHGGIKRSGGPFGEMNYVWQKTSHLQGINLRM